MPEAGEVVELEGREVLILAVDEARIEALRITLLSDTDRGVARRARLPALYWHVRQCRLPERARDICLRYREPDPGVRAVPIPHRPAGRPCLPVSGRLP